jgi:ABC-type Zn uptake system ZnuABC Zn-binding protein ZnuA
MRGLLLCVALAFGSAPAAGAPLAAVATITPLGFLVQELGGERVSVRVLVPPGASPHAFEPRPSDLAAVAGAALFVSAGAGVFLDDLDDRSHGRDERVGVRDFYDGLAFNDRLIRALSGH